MSEFEPIDHIWNLQTLKENERKVRLNLLTLCVTLGINGGSIPAVFMATRDIQGTIVLMEMFIGQAGLATGLAMYRDRTLEKIESIENLLENLGKTRDMDIQPQFTPTTDCGSEIIKA